MFRVRTHIGVLALCATALIAVGCGDKATSGSKTAASGAGAKDAMVDALMRVAEIKTGQMNLKATVGGATDTKLSGSGPFDVTDRKNPKFNIKISFATAQAQQSIGFALIDKSLYFGFGDRYFEIPAASKSSGNSPSPLAGLGKALDPDRLQVFAAAFSQYISDVKVSGTSTLDGVEVTSYSGKLDLAGAAAAALKASKKERKTSSLPLPGLSDLNNPDRLKESIKDAQLTIGVGSDGLIHSGGLEATLKGTAGGATSKLDLDLVVEGLNKPVEVKKPENAVKGNGMIEQLLKAFGGGGSFGAGSGSSTSPGSGY